MKRIHYSNPWRNFICLPCLYPVSESKCCY